MVRELVIRKIFCPHQLIYIFNGYHYNQFNILILEIPGNTDTTVAFSVPTESNL